MEPQDRREDAIPLFLSFCIEQYKHAHALSGEESMLRLSRCGALTYLEENYEVLTTQSPQWILEEVNEYVQKHLQQ